MSGVLSEEEINALLELFRVGNTSTVEKQAEKESLVEHDLQRRFFRSSQNLPAVLREGGKSYRVTATNISLGGVFVRSPLPIAIGEKVGLSLELPAPEVCIDVSGCVCWQKKADDEMLGLGIRFSSLTTEAIWAIIANIEQARKKSL